MIHPPIVLENLLPVSGTFELVNEKDSSKSVLWSAVIEPGRSKPVHSVTMDASLLLLINLDFCRSSEGTLIHTPDDLLHNSSTSLPGTIYKGLKGFLEENFSTKTQSSIILTDSVGQRLRLQIQNKMGGGGHRHILVYCPYWVVNTSQYTLRLKEEGSKYLPAGTVTAQRSTHLSPHPCPHILFSRNGRLPLLSNTSRLNRFQPAPFSLGAQSLHNPHHHSLHTQADFLEVEEKVYPGSPGPLHSSKVREIEIDSPLQNLLSDLSFDQMRSMSSMFNFLEESDSRLLGSQKVIAQLDYSNWSNSFTLESVGVNQVLSVDHSDKGMLELSFRISSAPGKLAIYTKIIRFSPRFVVVNRLPVIAQVIQVNGFLHEKVPIQVSPGCMKPFHLPAVFGERQVAIDVDGPWLRSVSFDIDHLGSHTLRIKKWIDPSTLEHIMTRGTPEYDVYLPPGEEFGLWFETDWDHQQIVVMKIRKGSVAATRTDIQEGDVLLRVDNESISQLPFEAVMERLKKFQQSEEGVNLTFLTVEEKMRLLRLHAMVGQPIEDDQSYHYTSSQQYHRYKKKSLIPSLPPAGVDDLPHLSLPHGTHISLSSQSSPCEEEGEGMQRGGWNGGEKISGNDDINQESIIRVQMKSVDSSIFMIISEPDKNARPEYQLVNNSCGYSLHYRQKGMYGGRWSILDPGDSVDYVFDDPTKSRSIHLRVGQYFLCPSPGRLLSLPSTNEHPLAFGCFSANSSDVLVSHILLDEIGSKSLLSIPALEKKLEVTVNSNGPTKVLTVTSQSLIKESELLYTLGFLHEQVSEITTLLSQLEELKVQEIMSSPSPLNSPSPSRQLSPTSIQPRPLSSSHRIDLISADVINHLISNSIERLQAKQDSSKRKILMEYFPEESTLRDHFLHSLVPFTSLFGPIITKRNQIVVEVLQSTGLKSAPLGGTDESFCEISLRCANNQFG